MFPTYKKSQVSEVLTSKSIPPSLKKVEINEKDLSSHEMKRMMNYLQYREFLLAINLSNRIVVFPDS